MDTKKRKIKSKVVRVVEAEALNSLLEKWRKAMSEVSTEDEENAIGDCIEDLKQTIDGGGLVERNAICR